MTMRAAVSGAALLMSVALVAGCSHAVDGNAKPAPDLARPPLSAETIKQVPLDSAALFELLGQNLVSHDAPESGGADNLFDAKTTVTPAGCRGVVEVMQKSVYEAVDVKGIAAQTWLTSGDPGKVMLVAEGVVALSTAGQADALFGKFAAQWRQCGASTVRQLNGPTATTNVVDDVHVTDEVAATTITQTMSLPNMPPLRPNRVSRAIGVKRNCLIEVQVVFFTGRQASAPGPADVNTSGADLVRAMQEKIAGLA